MSIADKYRPRFTYDDYAQWEGRWELIEGMPYAMSPSPVREHQIVNGNLYSIFREYIKKSCKHCKVLISPLDWKINDETVVQLDLMIICKEFTTKFLEFAPTLIIEVLSPATAYKDRHEKFELYEQHGVKYYLIVDPQFKKIEIYELIDNKYQPISISPADYEFTLDQNCKSPVSFAETWD